MHEDLLPVIAELEQAVEAGDASAAAAIVRRLDGEEIYSGNEFYERLHAVEAELCAVLFDGLGPAEFGQLMGENRHFYFVWESLEKMAPRISAVALWELKDYMGLPPVFCCPKLHATLADSDNERISEHLIETIDRLAAAEADEGSSLSSHEQTMSAFRFVRWAPDDKGLGACVRLLAMRGDDRARAACRRYLLELPWGADRKATVGLLEGLSGTRSVENHDLFKDALAVHRQPAVLRTWLWGAVGEGNPTEALLGAIEDLAGSGDDVESMVFVEYLDSALSQANSQEITLEREPIIAAAENVDTTRWSWLLRGYYGNMLKEQLPEVDVERVSKGFERAAISVADAWEMVRLDHMGCIFPLLLMFGMGLLIDVGLNYLFGEPVRAGWLPLCFFWAWIGCAVSTVRTHFSGHETLVSKVGFGVLYFTLLVLTLITAFLVRIG